MKFLIAVMLLFPAAAFSQAPFSKNAQQFPESAFEGTNLGLRTVTLLKFRPEPKISAVSLHILPKNYNWRADVNRIESYKRAAMEYHIFSPDGREISRDIFKDVTDQVIYDKVPKF